jgi:O-acetyl-ADP-ribose deacetylase (regulator of RNase III)
LPAKKVIHTVGPIYQGLPKDAEMLASCYQKSLGLAIEHGLRSIAFPSISTGAYGYPLPKAAAVAMDAVIKVLQDSPGSLEEVRFVLFRQEAYAVFESELLRKS